MMSLPKIQQLCILCQACCKYVSVDFPPETEELVKVRGVKDNTIELPCQHLCKDGCKIYGTGKRAEACRVQKPDLSDPICIKGINEIMK
jgi:Fe-S-cluster containining protein